MSAPENLWADSRRLIPSTVNTAVLLLHGLGSSADDLIELAPALQQALPHTAFISPNAPFSCDLAPIGYQWFSLQSWSEEKLWEGIEKAAPLLEQMISDVKAEFSLPTNRIALLGFSQGSMMSLHLAPRMAEQLACVVGFSGALIAPEKLEDAVKSRPPVLLVHGQIDQVVPYAAMGLASVTLEGCGFKVETESRPMLQHGIDNEGIVRAAAFLQQHLPDSKI